jgi:hypothetical protein
MRCTATIFLAFAFVCSAASCSEGAILTVYVDGGTPTDSGASGGGGLGSSVEGGNVGSGSGGSGGGTGSSGAASSSSSTGGGSLGAALDASCPTSVLSALLSVSDAASAIAGRWQICTGVENVIKFGAPGDTVGIEFTQPTTNGGSCVAWSGGGPCMGGYIYFLVQGTGGLVRGQGNAYQKWYALFGSGAGTELALNQTPTNGSWTTAVSASASPREFYIETIDYTDGARLVPAP